MLVVWHAPRLFSSKMSTVWERVWADGKALGDNHMVIEKNSTERILRKAKMNVQSELESVKCVTLSHMDR